LVTGPTDLQPPEQLKMMRFKNANGKLFGDIISAGRRNENGADVGT